MPVSVLRQVQGKPNVQYHVLGIAITSGWDNGYFFFEGFSPHGLSYGKGTKAEIEVLKINASDSTLDESEFDPKNLLDTTQRIIASIVRRREQNRFRTQLLTAYEEKCAISLCAVEETLEAAHITPYWGLETNVISNRLLLRSDLHVLFDLSKIAINSQDMSVILAPALFNTEYELFHGIRLHLPSLSHNLPNKLALDHHRSWTGL